MDLEIVDTAEEPNAPPAFSEALRFWWKLGWISFGGTAAHIAIMHDFLVDRKRWISNAHFLHALSLCMLLPGPEAQQLATYIGWKLHGRKGGIAAGTLFILPSVFILLALSLIYVRFGDLPWIAAMFGGLKPTVVALVILALLRIAGRALTSPLQWATATAALLAIAFFHAPLPIVMLAAVALGALAAWRFPASLTGEQTDTPDSTPEVPPENRAALRTAATTVAAGVGLGLLPLPLLYAFGRDFGFWKQLALFFTRTALVTIGGSYTVIPYVAHVAVNQYHWLSPAQMVDGFALAETTPGPLIIVVAFVGFMAGFNHFHGSLPLATTALLLTTYYTFLPCFLFVFAGAPLVERTRNHRGVEAVLKLIMAVVVAAILSLTLFLGRSVLFPRGSLRLAHLDVVALIWIIAALLLLRIGKANVIAVILLSIAAGLVRWLLLSR